MTRLPFGSSVWKQEYPCQTLSKKRSRSPGTRGPVQARIPLCLSLNLSALLSASQPRCALRARNWVRSLWWLSLSSWSLVAPLGLHCFSTLGHLGVCYSWTFGRRCCFPAYCCLSQSFPLRIAAGWCSGKSAILCSSCSELCGVHDFWRAPTASFPYS